MIYNFVYVLFILFSRALYFIPPYHMVISKLGFSEFQLYRRKLSQAPGPQKSSGEYIYCVKETKTDIVSRVLLTGCKGAKDPLSGVANCFLKLDANKKNIIGIRLSTQCIVKKQPTWLCSRLQMKCKYKELTQEIRLRYISII